MTALGVDINRGGIADTRVPIADGSPLAMRHNRRRFDPAWSEANQKAWIHMQINQMVLPPELSGRIVNSNQRKGAFTRERSSWFRPF